MEFIIPFSKISEDKKSIVGGKSYSLGVLIQNGINVPDGFAVTTGAYHAFRLEGISQGEAFSQRALEAFDRLNVEKVAVRSSAVAEDSENESWAGQLESFLNVDRDHLLEAIQLCWKSGDSDRIRAYMKDKEISEDKRAVGVAVQAMIPSEVAGVMFTSDPTSLGDDILIEAGLGLGEAVVQAMITPDQYRVNRNLEIIDKKIFKQELKIDAVNGKSIETLLDDETGSAQKLQDEYIVELARQALAIESVYGKPMDTEWSLQGGNVYIVQARPITASQVLNDRQEITIELTQLLGDPITTGLAASGGVVSGKVCTVASLEELAKVEAGTILITKATTPDYVAVFDKVTAIVTQTGGLVSHTALISRELGIPAVVGVGAGLGRLADGMEITVDGYNGNIYGGKTDKVYEVNSDSAVFEPIESTGDSIHDFLNAVSSGTNEANELWPLSPGQLLPYLDVSSNLDMLEKFKLLIHHEKRNFKEISELFERPDQIRNYLMGVSCSGLKVARRLGIADVTKEDTVNLMQWLLDTLYAKVDIDPLALEGRHYTWSQDYANEFVLSAHFSEDSELIRASNLLNVALFNYIWAFYWDYFIDCGYEAHGTYPVVRGNDTMGLIVRDGFNLQPTDVWGDVSEFTPFRSIRLSVLYDTPKIYLKMTGRIVNTDNLVNHVKAVSVVCDGEYVNEPEQINLITEQLKVAAQKQIQLVNNMPQLDKVRRGDKMLAYARKGFHAHFGEWYHSDGIERTIENLGTKYIDDFTEEAARSKNDIINLYDPSNDYVPGLDA